MCRFDFIICPKCKVEQFRARPNGVEVDRICCSPAKDEMATESIQWACKKYIETDTVCVYDPKSSKIAKDVVMLCDACDLLKMWEDNGGQSGEQ